MTDRDQILADFFAGHAAPARDGKFVAAALARLEARLGWERVTLWAAGGAAATAILALSGPALMSGLAAMSPALAPIAITWTVLAFTRLLPGRIRL